MTVTDLARGAIALDGRFRGVAFAGGFSYGDVLDSAKGWAASLRFDARERHVLRVRAREDTFALGVCNGCQLMALLGWVPGARALDDGGAGGAAATTTRAGRLPAVLQPRFVENASGKFESRYVALRVEPSPCDATLLRGMAGSVLGVWLAHGEGRLRLPDAPGGAREGDGRARAPSATPVGARSSHACATSTTTASRPSATRSTRTARRAARPRCARPTGARSRSCRTPTRCFRKWQCPWLPRDWAADPADGGLEAAPWLRLFQNARAWCEETATEA